MDKTKYLDLAIAAMDSEPLEFERIFNELMDTKTQEAMEGRKSALVFDMFNTKKEESEDE